MASRRQQRVAELLHQEISILLEFHTQDPRIGFVTVTEVEITPDLKNATVFITTLTDDERETLAGLASATSFFRRELARKLKLRYTPTLTFKIDPSAAYGQKIESLLAKIDIPPADDAPDTDTPIADDQ
ncbi:MAG TPA: 30S ribosome-binding factor RbfA [Anaerolineae bacterium]|nr:30S ribosome-binding factor RbfA [Anaerolineae bacterium]